MSLFKTLLGGRREPSPDNSQELIGTYSGKAMAQLIWMKPSEKTRFFQERGQKSFLISPSLPTKIEGVNGLDGERALHQMGVQLGPCFEKDPLFRRAKLPQGWQKVPPDEHHPTITVIVDDQGRQRGSVYFNNTPSDRTARLDLQTRFSVSLRGYELDERITCDVLDAGTAIFSTPPVDRCDDHLEDVRHENKARQEATTWLDDHYPDWRNPAAYWDALP